MRKERKYLRLFFYLENATHFLHLEVADLLNNSELTVNFSCMWGAYCF
jgi:hypothetical protein